MSQPNFTLERGARAEDLDRGRVREPPRSYDRGRFRHVLVCLDGSAFSDRLLGHAAAIVASGPRRLTLLRVVETARHHPEDPLDWELSRAEAQGQLREAASRLGTLMPVDLETAEGTAPEAICLFAARNDVDLIVLSSHGEHGPSRWPLASTARKLIGLLPASVLLVPTGAGSAGPGAEVRYRRVALVLDGSPQSESALPLALRLARVHDGELSLVHIAGMPRLPRVGPCSSDDLALEAQFSRRCLQLGELYLQRLQARIGERGVRVRHVLESHHEVASALSTLLVRERVSLAVLTAHGEGVAASRSFGSIALQIVESANFPVLVVSSESDSHLPSQTQASPPTRSPSAEA